MKVKGAKSYIERALRIESPLVQHLVTEKYQKKCSIVTNTKGASIVVNPPYLTKELEKFLIASDMKVEKRPYELRRGKSEIANGVKVKILPGEFVSYDRGCVIKVREDNELSRENVSKVLNWLSNHGIDIKRECILVTEDRHDNSCIFKR
jgi:hypothetical protein